MDLKSLLLDLASDPRKLVEYRKDRGAYLARIGLPPDVCEALLSGDQEKVVLLVGVAVAVAMGVQQTMKRKKPRKRAARGKAARRTTRKKS